MTDLGRTSPGTLLLQRWKARCAQSVWARPLAGLVLCLGIAGIDLWQRPAVLQDAQAAWPERAGPNQGAAMPVRIPASSLVKLSGGHIPMPADTPAAHASTLLAMPDDHPAAVMAFWFAGSRESGPDVQIAASQFDRATQQWTPARFVVNRFLGRYRLGFAVRRLGNPVAWRDGQGRVHLFVVATGLGGWAAGRIVHMVQANEGSDFDQLAFRPLRVLPLSWLWKTSHLVRAMPLPLADGGMVLPVYFELGIKYPVALRFDAFGNFRGMVRMSNRGHLLQPTLLMRSERDWVALMRDNSVQRKIKVTQTLDAGQHWQDAPDLALANPDSSIAALSLRPDLMLLAHNSDRDSRTVLDLSSSPDGVNWTKTHTLERGVTGSEYSYPSMVWADHSLWVSYTNLRQEIAWQRFGFPALAK
jgi:predicted neuraminidase